MIRVEYFKWENFRIPERYDLLQKQLAKYDLIFPPFAEVKLVQSETTATDSSTDDSDDSDDTMVETDSGYMPTFEKTQQFRLWSRNFKKYDHGDLPLLDQNWRIKKNGSSSIG